MANETVLRYPSGTVVCPAGCDLISQFQARSISIDPHILAQIHQTYLNTHDEMGQEAAWLAKKAHQLMLTQDPESISRLLANTIMHPTIDLWARKPNVRFAGLSRLKSKLYL